MPKSISKINIDGQAYDIVIPTAQVSGLEEYLEQNAQVPTPTEANNGMFLKVIDGAPAWAPITRAENVKY